MSSRGKRKTVSIKGAEFFKVYFPHQSERRIMVPPDFVKDFKRTIREKVVLKDLCGKKWQLSVKESLYGEYFLENEWKSYLDYHKLKMGEFLVLRYDGAFSFVVKIFGTNGCKKKDSDNVSVKIEDKSDNEMEEGPTSRKIPRLDQSLKACNNTPHSERLEQNEASECPFFISSAEAKSKAQKFKMRIPDEVINGHNLELDTDMILKNENGKEWPVKVILYKGAKLFGKGWYDFQVDNGVKSNDRCKFTFDNKRSICKTINVQILRSGQDPSPKKTLKRGRGRPRKIAAAADDNFWVAVPATANSSDEKVEKVSYSDKLPEFFKFYVEDIHSETMIIPPDFIKEFGKNIPTICTLENPAGLSWKVSMNKDDDNWVFQNGWPEFVDENSIQNRDFLTFAYASNSTFYVKVYSDNGCLKMAEEIDDEILLEKNKASQQVHAESPKNRRSTRSKRTRTEDFLETELSQQDGCLKMAEEINDETDEILLENKASQQVHAESPKNRRSTRSKRTRTEDFVETELSQQDGCLKMAEEIDDEILLENEESQQVHAESPKNRRNTRSKRTRTEDLLETEASQQENPNRRNTRRSRATNEDLIVTEASQQEIPKNRRISTRSTTEHLLELEASQQGYLIGHSNNRRITRLSARTESPMKIKSLNANPSFKRVITKSYLTNSYLTIPMRFWSKHMRKNSEKVTLLAKNTSWDMNVRETGDRINLSKGVSDFARINSLRVGSVCNFELIDSNSNKCIFNVTVDE